jgi:hypothetical protein
MASRRGYLTQPDLAEYANIIIEDPTEADDQISQAEEMIDSYVGPQVKHFPQVIYGKMQSSGVNNLQLDPIHTNVYQKNYLLNCWIEIIGGTGQGQTRKITTQTYAGIITTESDFTTALDSTSFYKIWQLGKFPRHQDVYFDGINTPNQYYMQITEMVKRATAAQVEYIIEMGQKFFSSQASQLNSEKIGDYAYTKGNSKNPQDQLIAPKAKEYLTGIKVRTGTIIT